jgi:hypothetical protein
MREGLDGADGEGLGGAKAAKQDVTDAADADAFAVKLQDPNRTLTQGERGGGSGGGSLQKGALVLGQGARKRPGRGSRRSVGEGGVEPSTPAVEGGNGGAEVVGDGGDGDPLRAVHPGEDSVEAEMGSTCSFSSSSAHGWASGRVEASWTALPTRVRQPHQLALMAPDTYVSFRMIVTACLLDTPTSSLSACGMRTSDTERALPGPARGREGSAGTARAQSLRTAATEPLRVGASARRRDHAGRPRWRAVRVHRARALERAGPCTPTGFAVPLVYNTKRSGSFTFGNRRFLLRCVAFPENPPTEWFVVDLFEHAEQAATSPTDLAEALAPTLAQDRVDRARLLELARCFGSRDADAHCGRRRSERLVSFDHKSGQEFGDLGGLAVERRLLNAIPGMRRELWRNA